MTKSPALRSRSRLLLGPPSSLFGVRCCPISIQFSGPTSALSSDALVRRPSHSVPRTSFQARRGPDVKPSSLMRVAEGSADRLRWGCMPPPAVGNAFATSKAQSRTVAASPPATNFWPFLRGESSRAARTPLAAGSVARPRSRASSGGGRMKFGRPGASELAVDRSFWNTKRAVVIGGLVGARDAPCANLNRGVLNCEGGAG